MVDGPVLGVLAGLALVTFGRALVSPTGAELIGPGAFGVMAGAAGAVALRWGTLDLGDIRGIQGVLGPTVAVEPQAAAVMAAAALGAATIALGLWLGPAPHGGPVRWWWWLETSTGALLLASLFVGPQATDLLTVLTWLGSAAVIGLSAIGIRKALGSRSVSVRLAVVGLCAAVVSAAAAVIGSSA
jgi:hypothetical protein